jgi:drug/metabolite transporter (DMT)-like permease
MILFATNPIWTSLGNIIAFKEPITRRMIISFTVAFIGIVLLTKDQLSTSSDHTLGNLSAIVSAFLFAVYLISGKKARTQMSNLNFAIVMYAICGFFFLMASLLSGAPFISNYSAISWLSVAGLIIVPTLLGHFLFTYVMSWMNLAVMTCGKLIEPVIASFIAYFIFREKITIMTYVAFVFTSFAIINLFWPQIKRSLHHQFNK